MKRSEINRYINEAKNFFAEHQFHLPVWVDWSPTEWATKGDECEEIRRNQLGWDVTDFATGKFEEIGLTLVTIRNGNVKYDKKTYCEKIMFVRENQVTPTHFHWKKMEDIIHRGGGTFCVRLWKADENEQPTDAPCSVQIDGVTTVIPAGEVLRLQPGQSISFEPYMYHEFWSEGGHSMIGEVSTVNDDENDNRFLQSPGRYPSIEEDEPAQYLLCNEYNK
ncbi:MAG: D-lyxose/D-mannose family sugar isomerase [Alistipes sp.]|nr:D-lyxose/D-mannose family sugar isomerase [Alistipes sp.]MBR7096906.1 D-lyxose/D-mannose family sugar isomerase [Alistipes sp.]